MLAAAWTCRGVKFDGTAMLVAIIATASTASGVPGSALCNVSKASVTTAPTAAIGVTVARVASRVTIVDMLRSEILLLNLLKHFKGLMNK